MIYYIKLAVSEVTAASMKHRFMCMIQTSTVAYDYSLVSYMMPIITTEISGT